MGNVVVTGGANGIGAALSHRFARAGHAVAVLDLEASAAEEVARSIEASGGTARAIACDVTRAESCDAAIAEVIDAWSGVDVLVNNAGITHVGLVRDTDPAVLRRVMEVNFFGAVHCTRAALDSLLERSGLVAALSSVAGFAPLATRAGYVASKHALTGFFETLRGEHARDGLAVTLAFPSFVDTGIGDRALAADGRPLREAVGPGARTGVAHQIGPEQAAETIFRGIERRRRVVWVGREARLASWLVRLAPRAYEHLMLQRSLA
jgi:NAD(P)-dependent dehydrogenase (short-subunit alcohol dehydrogenase family)